MPHHVILRLQKLLLIGVDGVEDRVHTDEDAQSSGLLVEFRLLIDHTLLVGLNGFDVHGQAFTMDARVNGVTEKIVSGISTPSTI